MEWEVGVFAQMYNLSHGEVGDKCTVCENRCSAQFKDPSFQWGTGVPSVWGTGRQVDWIKVTRVTSVLEDKITR